LIELHVLCESVDAVKHTPSDLQLIEAGSAEGFGVLFDRHAPLLRRWLRAETRSGEAAADLVAETFAQAWAGRSALRIGRDESAWPWLFGIARNLVRQWRRRDLVERRGRERLGMALGPYGAQPYDPDTAKPDPDLARAVSDALSLLPASQRDVLRLRVIEELDYSEVARRLAVTQGTARIRVHRALQSLRAAVTGGTP
jgi:RNA polymerase sigma factor (sigma-70 family)